MASIMAYLCDSRSCNQMGGGEHLKGDIEDVLRLVNLPSGRSRVTLTTCYGLCNRSPNMKLTSRGGNLLLQPRTKRRLRNDGGLRMRVDDDGVLENEEEEATDKVIISDVTIPRVARAVGLENRPLAVRAIECKSKGNRCLRDGHYKDALRHFSRGRSLLLFSEEERDDCPSLAYLQASMWLSCAKTRIQWASDELDDGAEKDDMLQVAAYDTFRLLTANNSAACREMNVDVGGNVETTVDTIDTVMAKLVCSCATSETQRITRKLVAGADDGRDIPVPVTRDIKILSQLCVVVADVWCGLIASSADTRTIFADGALFAYTAVLMAAPAKAKLLPAKERRRIKKAIAVLSAGS